MLHAACFASVAAQLAFACLAQALSSVQALLQILQGRWTAGLFVFVFFFFPPFSPTNSQLIHDTLHPSKGTRLFLYVCIQLRGE